MYKHKSPVSRSPSTRAFFSLAKFYIAKYLKQEVDDDLSVCMDECSLSVSLSKGNDVTTCIGEVSYGLLTRSCVYCPKLITVAPETRDKEICQSHMNIE